MAGLTSFYAIWRIYKSRNDTKKSLFDVLSGDVKNKSQLNSDIFKKSTETFTKIPPPSIPRPISPNIPRFDFSDPSQTAEGLKYLELHGYLVVSNVLSNEEIEKAKDLFWGWVNGISKRYPNKYSSKMAEKCIKRD